MKILTTPRLAATALLLLALSGCSASSAGESTPTATASAADALSVDRAWIKAADSGMTAAFGDLKNAGKTDATIVRAASPASPDIQLHETVAGKDGSTSMKEMKGGFVIHAGKTLELAPGGNHLMFMDLSAPIRAGDEVEITLTLSDGSTYRFAAPVKDFSGADEHYDEGTDDDK